jgi:alcohol dehydrogenase, propanol-preferring
MRPSFSRRMAPWCHGPWLLWEERQLLSVANPTRQDGVEFLDVVPKAGIRATTVAYSLRTANEALADLRAGRFEGAAVLLP